MESCQAGSIETMDLPWVRPGLTVAAQIASWLNCPEPHSGQTWEAAAESALRSLAK